MPNMSSVVRFNKIPVTGFVPESSASAPASPVIGQLWTDTSVTPKLIRVWDGATWAPLNHYAGTGAGSFAAGDDSRITGAEQTSNKGAASGYASLDGSTKVPIAQLPTGSTGSTVTIGNDSRLSDQRVPTDGSVTGGPAGAGVKIAVGTITDVNVAAANKDGVAGTASLRTLGTGATQAAAGNDARLSDTRTPTAGSVVDASVGAGAAIAESKLSLASDAAAGTASRRTLGTGALQAMPGNTTLSSIAAPTADRGMAGFKITNLGAPSAASDAARLADVQAASAGIDVKPSVRAASTANVNIASPGAAIDGVTLSNGDRVLLKNQTTTSQNGPWIFNGAASAMTRPANETVTANSFWFTEEGTANADTSWMVTTNGAITLDTTGLTLAQFGAPGTVSGTANRITVSGGVVDIAATYVGQTSITTLGTITAGTWTGTTIAVANGGTGATTAAAARTNLGAAQVGYAATLGAITAGTPLVVTHNLGTQDVIAQVRDASTNEVIFLDIINASTNTVTVTSGISYAASALRIVVIPVA